MENSSLVSVIIPCYNSEAYLKETILSVINQTYTNWELIVVDDGSTDRSVDIVLAFSQQDSRIKSFKKQNGGQASARNFGVKQAKGALIAFLDADDLWVPDKLKWQLQQCDFTQYSMCYTLGFYYTQEESGKFIQQEYNWVTGSFSGSAFLKILITSNLVNTCTVILTRELFERMNGFNELSRLRGTEDFELWLRIALANENILGLSDRTVLYRIYGGGVHHNVISQCLGKVKALQLLIGNKEVERKVLLKQMRYFYRTLHEKLFEKNSWNELKQYYAEYFEVDSGLVARIQRLLLHLFNVKFVYLFSKFFLLRIGYRLENLTY